MPKKKPLGEATRTLAVPRVARDLPGAGSRWRVLQDSADCTAGAGDRAFGASSEEVSTACPDIASLDDMRDISRLLDSTLQSHSLYETFSHTVDTDWKVREVSEILADVRQFVHEQKPWRPPLDDSILEKKVRDKRLEPHDSCLIILPDNRVQNMEDRLSLRVRAELLNEPLPPTGSTDALDDSLSAMPSTNHLGTSKLTSETSNSGAAVRKKIRNPWYMNPKDWHNKADPRLIQKKDGLPYMPAELAMQFAQDGGRQAQAGNSNSGGQQGGALDKKEVGEGDSEYRPLTQREKESLPIINDYKEHCQLKKQRLPYFLL